MYSFIVLCKEEIPFCPVLEILCPRLYIASNSGSVNITEYVSFHLLLVENGLPVRRKRNTVMTARDFRPKIV